MKKRYKIAKPTRALKQELEEANASISKLQKDLCASIRETTRCQARAQTAELTVARLSYGEVRDIYADPSSRGEKEICVRLRFDPRYCRDDMIGHAMRQVAEKLNRAWSSEAAKHFGAENFDLAQFHRAESMLHHKMSELHIVFTPLDGIWRLRERDANSWRGSVTEFTANSIVDLLKKIVTEYAQ